MRKGQIMNSWDAYSFQEYSYSKFLSIFSLGLQHDGDPQTLNCNTDMKYIMAPSFAESANPHMWSECSQQQLTDFLR